MNSNTSLAIFAVLAAMALVGATATYIVVQAEAAQTITSPPSSNNHGQCKKGQWSDNACH
jgi:hypothetical protein